jgi:integrase
MPVGTFGRIDFYTIGPKRVRARAHIRDYDGVRRPVTRYGPTRAVAERRLREALRDRTGPTEGAVTSETKLRELAGVWLAEVKASDLADGSKQLYERDLEMKVLPALGGLTCREADVPACDRFLKAVRDNSGSSKARSCKTVLSLMMQLAVRHGAIQTNPVREVARIPRGHRRKARALATEQQDLIRDKVQVDDIAGIDQDDVADLIEVLDGTGMRIGEALGLRAPHRCDDPICADGSTGPQPGVIEVNAIAVRLKGGASIQSRPKSEAGWRVIAVPANVVAVCDRRAILSWPGNPHSLFFPTKLGGPRDASNANTRIKQAATRVDKDLAWVTSHTFRKTVATRMDEAGLSARAIADHIGHSNPSMTQDVYMGRGVAVAEAATILGRNT